jgi:hypothetical protein
MKLSDVIKICFAALERVVCDFNALVFTWLWPLQNAHSLTGTQKLGVGGLGRERILLSVHMIYNSCWLKAKLIKHLRKNKELVNFDYVLS